MALQPQGGAAEVAESTSVAPPAVEESHSLLFLCSFDVGPLLCYRSSSMSDLIWTQNLKLVILMFVKFHSRNTDTSSGCIKTTCGPSTTQCITIIQKALNWITHMGPTPWRPEASNTITHNNRGSVSCIQLCCAGELWSGTDCSPPARSSWWKHSTLIINESSLYVSAALGL